VAATTQPLVPGPFHGFRRSLAEASERGRFRVTHYSLQGDHAHLIVEAHGWKALGRGMMSIGAPLARAVNRVGQRRRARRPLPPPQPALTARGTARPGLRPARCTAPPVEATPQGDRLEPGSHRPCELGTLVRRLPAFGRRPLSGGNRHARGRETQNLAAESRMATPRAAGSRGSAGCGDAGPSLQTSSSAFQPSRSAFAQRAS